MTARGTSTDETSAPASLPGVGTVVSLDGGGYALVVGTEKALHQHEDANGSRTTAETRDHLLIVDLPAPRRYELDHTPVS